ncbi:beta-N-acetylhexosaminidase [Roseibium sp. RKSG952]|uniref:beta-N-acetylhexosaminidase n=1 Tax=Roseibium sp. RKSG952 TaxID=2529384 RepID=UPI0012BC4ECA|nr:beta-N-acetylhexosaminidase [Roseibium sp. RKSG952]MTH97247.1 beta-N-acetylhexosaminidase [Roseibium sp. RKSG952]
MTKAFITGCSGHALTSEETAFFRSEDPWGLILFRRNIDTPGQVRELVRAFRACVGRPDAPVLIDQEGGRVQRLLPPHWPSFPPQRVFGDLYRENGKSGLRAAWLGARLIADTLTDLEITVDCLPLLDVAAEGMSDVIGDRSFGNDPAMVAELGRAVSDGLMAGGVLPVMKHVPGHGRGTVDSHLHLPRVAASRLELEKADFIPFRSLSDSPMAMTAHIVFEAIDPDRPATQSREVIETVIRGQLAFDGLLMTDDVSMLALSGSIRERSERSYEAGCDIVLHCNGEMDQMRELAQVSPVLQGKTLERCRRALSFPSAGRQDSDIEALWAEFRDLTGWTA